MIRSTECKQCHLLYAGEHHVCPIKIFHDLIERMSTLVSDRMMYDANQSRYNWQEGAEHYMSSIDKRVRDLERKNEDNPIDCAQDANKKALESWVESMKNWPSHARKHFEKCLREKNDRIKLLEEQLHNCNNRYQDILHREKMREEEVRAWHREYDALAERYNKMYKDYLWLINASPRNKRLVEKSCGCINSECKGKCGI
jgi:chromosome segregation ATPase